MEIINKKLISEVCVGNLTEAKKAEDLGANRIELCYDLSKAGLTPPYELIKEAKNIIKKIQVFVIIRPTDRDFIYTEEEFELMKSQINYCKEFNIDGVVFGILKENNNEIIIDIERNKELVELAMPMKITFHMAFDLIGEKEINNDTYLNRKFEAIDDLINIGFNRILTKGGFNCNNAIDGKDYLKKYVEYAKDRIIIMPGGGVNKDNKYFLSEYINTNEVHGSKIVGNLN
jgi:copper homeostasis protein